MDHEIGHRVEVGRLAVDDGEPRAVALRDLREAGRGVDDEGGAEDQAQVGGQYLVPRGCRDGGANDLDRNSSAFP